MPSRNTSNQVKHTIPRGEIVYNHGRTMRSSKTNKMNNDKFVSNIAQVPKMSKKISRQNDHNQRELAVITQKQINNQQAVIKALIY